MIADAERPAPAPLERLATAILRHPMTMTLKAVARNAVWTVKGRRVVNPPLPLPVRSMLFVCLGNICRSPFAEHLAHKRLVAAGAAALRCASAGISARQSGEVPAHGRDVAAQDYGIQLGAHRPQILSRELVDAFDLIVVMEAAQLDLLRATYPHSSHRVVLLPLFDPLPVPAHQRYHIDDPFSQPRASFEASFRRIDRAVARLLHDLVPAAPAV